MIVYVGMQGMWIWGGYKVHMNEDVGTGQHSHVLASV